MAPEKGSPEGVGVMAKGIYKRTKQMRENISLGRRGITPWNKGVSKYQRLLKAIKGA